MTKKIDLLDIFIGAIMLSALGVAIYFIYFFIMLSVNAPVEFEVKERIEPKLNVTINGKYADTSYVYKVK